MKEPSTPDEEAGAIESFEDAALYDFEYRRRRADVSFYRMLARERLGFRPGPVADLACGTGRLLVPLLRDGHTVVGLDRSAAMLTRAAARVARLRPVRRTRALLVRGDLRAFAFAPRFSFVVAAFHSVQHVYTRAGLLQMFRRVRGALLNDGWFAFDVLPPDPEWLARDPQRRWARTRFRHPVDRGRYEYTTNHDYDVRRRVLHMRLYYQPIDDTGRARGPERIVRLTHRQLTPAEIQDIASRAGLQIIARYGGFDGRPLDAGADEHVYVARPAASRDRT